MRAFRELRGLPRDIWILFFTALVNRMGTMAIPFLPLYLISEAGLTLGQSGTILAAFGVGAFFAGPCAGWVSDRVGPVTLMRAGLFGSAAILIAFPWIKGFWPILFATFALATTEEAFRPACWSVVADWAPKGKTKITFAALRLFVNLGMSLGPLAGGFIAAHSLRALFWVNGAGTLAAAFVLAQAKKKTAKVQPAPVAGTAIWTDFRLLYFCLALVPVMMVFFQHESSLPLHLTRDLGLSPKIYGFLFTVNTLLIIAIEIPLTAMTAHWTARRTLTVGALLVSTGFGILTFHFGVVGLFASVVVWTFGEMFIFPAATAYVDEIAPPNKRGAYMGMYSASFSLAFVLGPAAGLRIYDLFGAGRLWPIAFGVGTLSVIVFAVMRPTVSAPRENTDVALRETGSGG